MNQSMKLTMKNPILRYRIAVAILLAALFVLALGYRDLRDELAITQNMHGLTLRDLREADERADQAESRIRSMMAPLISSQSGAANHLLKLDEPTSKPVGRE